MNALVSGQAGLALVIDGDRLASIHAADPEVMVDRQPRELRFLIGEGRGFVPLENVSREEISRQVSLAQDREESHAADREVAGPSGRDPRGPRRLGSDSLAAVALNLIRVHCC